MLILTRLFITYKISHDMFNPTKLLVTSTTA